MSYKKIKIKIVNAHLIPNSVIWLWTNQSWLIQADINLKLVYLDP